MSQDESKKRLLGFVIVELYGAPSPRVLRLLTGNATPWQSVSLQQKNHERDEHDIAIRWSPVHLSEKSEHLHQGRLALVPAKPSQVRKEMMPFEFRGVSRWTNDFLRLMEQSSSIPTISFMRATSGPICLISAQHMETLCA